MRIILASQSASRKKLMDQLGIKYEIIPSVYDENLVKLGADPKKYVKTLAEEKVKEVAKHLKNAIVIGCDTVVWYNNTLYEKPKYKMTAVEMLQDLSGTTHEVMTGWAVWVKDEKKVEENSGVTITKVKFRRLTDEEIVHFVDNNPVTSWSAAYNTALSAAASFVEHIDGSFNGFNGLPLEKIVPLIK